MDNLVSEFKEMRFDPPRINWRLFRSNDGSSRIIWFDREINIHDDKDMLEANVSRIDGPAITEFDKNGNLLSERWFYNNVSHHPNNKVDVTFYNLNGTVHRKTVNSYGHKFQLWQAEYAYNNGMTFIQVTDVMGNVIENTDSRYYEFLDMC